MVDKRDIKMNWVVEVQKGLRQLQSVAEAIEALSKKANNTQDAAEKQRLNNLILHLNQNQAAYEKDFKKRQRIIDNTKKEISKFNDWQVKQDSALDVAKVKRYNEDLLDDGWRN